MEQDLANRLRLSAMGDQAVASMDTHASLVAAYYLALVRHGLPDGFASALTMDWHANYWSRWFYVHLPDRTDRGI